MQKANHEVRNRRRSLTSAREGVDINLPLERSYIYRLQRDNRACNFIEDRVFLQLAFHSREREIGRGRLIGNRKVEDTAEFGSQWVWLRIEDKKKYRFVIRKASLVILCREKQNRAAIPSSTLRARAIKSFETGKLREAEKRTARYL